MENEFEKAATGRGTGQQNILRTTATMAMRLAMLQFSFRLWIESTPNTKIVWMSKDPFYSDASAFLGSF